MMNLGIYFHENKNVYDQIMIISYCLFGTPTISSFCCKLLSPPSWSVH